MEKKERDIIAKQLMEYIMLDNGALNRLEKEKYPKFYVNEIAVAASKFFDNYPELLTNEVLEQITMGLEEDTLKLYGHLEGFDELNTSLCDYFDTI